MRRPLPHLPRLYLALYTYPCHIARLSPSICARSIRTLHLQCQPYASPTPFHSILLIPHVSLSHSPYQNFQPPSLLPQSSATISHFYTAATSSTNFHFPKSAEFIRSAGHTRRHPPFKQQNRVDLVMAVCHTIDVGGNRTPSGARLNGLPYVG